MPKSPKATARGVPAFLQAWQRECQEKCTRFPILGNQVDDKESDGRLTQGEATQLRQAAEAIKASLGCKK